jgi:Domain of unknown function (DUF4124)
MKRWLFLLAIWVAAAANATVYKWVDPQGKVQYGDRPPDGVHADVVAFLGHRSDRTASSPAPSTARQAAPRATPNAPSSAANENIANSQAKSAVDKDVEETRAKQCADAKDRYQKYIASRRLYKEGKNGEREYLSSEQIDAERLNAKRDMDSVCNSAT